MAQGTKKSSFSISRLTNKVRRVFVNRHPTVDTAAPTGISQLTTLSSSTLDDIHNFSLRLKRKRSLIEITRFMDLPREIRDKVYDYALGLNLEPSLQIAQRPTLSQPAFIFKNDSCPKWLLVQADREACERLLKRTIVECECYYSIVNGTSDDRRHLHTLERMEKAHHLIERLEFYDPWRSNSQTDGLQEPMETFDQRTNIESIYLRTHLQTHELEEIIKTMKILRDACCSVSDSLGENIYISITSPPPGRDCPMVSPACFQQWSGSLLKLEKLI